MLVRLCGSVFVLLCGARVFFRAAVGMWSCREEANFVGVLLLDFLFFFCSMCVSSTVIVLLGVKGWHMVMIGEYICFVCFFLRCTLLYMWFRKNYCCVYVNYLYLRSTAICLFIWSFQILLNFKCLKLRIYLYKYGYETACRV